MSHEVQGGRVMDVLTGRHLRCHVYANKAGGHVHVRVFAAMVLDEYKDKDVTLGCAGTLTFREDEWPTVAVRMTQGGFDVFEVPEWEGADAVAGEQG